MCYICAPNQFKFYGKESLTVCIEYCDNMYDACAEAILKGSKINEIYSNGAEFCQSRRYNIDSSDNQEYCFFYKIQDDGINGAFWSLRGQKNLNFLLGFLSSFFVLYRS